MAKRFKIDTTCEGYPLGSKVQSEARNMMALMDVVILRMWDINCRDVLELRKV